MNINGFTRTVRLSLEFRGLTAQTMNEFVRMQKNINSHSHVSGTPASGPSDVNVPYVRLSRWPDTMFT